MKKENLKLPRCGLLFFCYFFFLFCKKRCQHGNHALFIIKSWVTRKFPFMVVWKSLFHVSSYLIFLFEAAILLRKKKKSSCSFWKQVYVLKNLLPVVIVTVFLLGMLIDPIIVLTEIRSLRHNCFLLRFFFHFRFFRPCQIFTWGALERPLEGLFKMLPCLKWSLKDPIRENLFSLCLTLPTPSLFLIFRFFVGIMLWIYNVEGCSQIEEWIIARKDKLYIFW